MQIHQNPMPNHLIAHMVVEDIQSPTSEFVTIQCIQANLDLEINKSECLVEAEKWEDLHMLEQIPTSKSDSSSSPENPRAKDFVEPEQKVQVREIVAEDTTLCNELPTVASTCQSPSGETKEEAVKSSRTRII